MTKYSFLTESTSGFFKPSIDSDGNPNGYDVLQHSESPDGKVKSTSFSSSRKWKSKINPIDLDSLVPCLNDFRDDIDKCDGAGEEDMCIRCNIIPKLKYKFAHHCHGLSDDIKKIFKDTSNNICDDLMKALDDPNSTKDTYKNILSKKYICDAD